MADDPNIRASDADRDRAAALLREHHAVGRLTSEEFDERLDQALAAKTVGEIDSLLRDLPTIDLYRLPHADLSRQPSPHRPPARRSDAWRAAWGGWFTVTLVCFVIWALTGFGYPWPLWVALPWGAVILGHWVSGAHSGGGHREVHRSRRANPPGPGGQEHGQPHEGNHDLPGGPAT
ncbi:MAG: DUF1707 domain-containing protein [Actinobacteria bacterium]|nr:DUF1707 domain-containing protein [Actinomycetota bacterium]